MPTLEQIRHVIRMMPAGTEIERRDRALIAFTILTGARDGATASMKLKHIDIDQGRVDQDARQVNTKFSKSFTTWFFPVGDDIRQIVVDWVNYLRRGEALGPRRSVISGNEDRGRRLVAILRHRVSTASIGAVPVPSARFSRMPSRLPVCPTSIRIAFGRHSLSSARICAAHRSNSRPGARTSATKRYLRHSQAMARSALHGNAKSSANWQSQRIPIRNSRKF